jgi:hypothetical protein
MRKPTTPLRPTETVSVRSGTLQVNEQGKFTKRAWKSKDVVLDPEALTILQQVRSFSPLAWHVFDLCHAPVIRGTTDTYSAARYYHPRKNRFDATLYLAHSKGEAVSFFIRYGIGSL